jgi:CheY-like chemotaxis protein
MTESRPIERMVLVDDSHADNVYHEVVIRRSGFVGDLKVFEQPTAALEYLRQMPDGPVCLVLLDINMPGMTGWEFAAAAEPLLASNQTVLLVMLTSSSAPADKLRARDMSMISGCLTKPLNRETVLGLLSGSLDAWKP